MTARIVKSRYVRMCFVALVGVFGWLARDKLSDLYRAFGTWPLIAAFLFVGLPFTAAYLMALFVVRDNLLNSLSIRLNEERGKLDDSVRNVQRSSERAEGALSDLGKLLGIAANFIPSAAKGLMHDDVVLHDYEAKMVGGDIFVVAPDVHYELDEKTQHFNVLVENVARADGPAYHYWLPNGSRWPALLQKLKDELAKKGVSDIDRRLSARVHPKLLRKGNIEQDGSFPAVAMSGLAIYRTSDRRIILCVQYCPREYDTLWNIVIPVEGESASLVNRAIDFLE